MKQTHYQHITDRQYCYIANNITISYLKFLFSCLLLLGGSSGCSGGRQLIPDEGGIGAGAEIPSKVTSNPVVESDKLYLVQAGRALEARNPEQARKLLEQVGDTNESKYLKARIADTLGNYKDAVSHYRALAGVWTFLEPDRQERTIKALAASGQYSEAADLGKLLWKKDKNNPRLRLKKKVAGWLLKADRSTKAIALLEKITSQSKGRLREELELQLATLYEQNNRAHQAVKLAFPLAHSAATAENMKTAIKILETAEGIINWTPKEQLQRAERFMKLKAWDDAASVIKPLIKNTNRELYEEAQWLNARLLFKRRRHYKEAIVALDQIIKNKGSHSNEALFLRARALSRLDYDEEAIVEYRSFAKKTHKKGRATEALFLASRLEFFLGKHKDSRIGMENLVGHGKKTRKPALTAGRVRDAHFIAGLSAILEGISTRGEAHLKAASKGSKSTEAIARNNYWYAVARLNSGKKDGHSLLRKICDKDPTTWYSLWAARRLEDAGLTLGSCVNLPLSDISKKDNPKPNDASLCDQVETKLEEISPLAAFYKSVGLYKDAAEALRTAEKKDKTVAGTRDWLIHYGLLDAPYYAIRRASIGLEWPPKAENMWRVEAAYPSPYAALVDTENKRHNLPEFLIYSIARKESLFNPDAVSRVGAMGMMQMMPHTYETNRLRAGLNPLVKGTLPNQEESIMAAGFELAHLLENFGGSVPLAIMAYNGGSAAVSRWLQRSGEFPMDVFVEKIGFAQTRNYVRRVFKNLVRYSVKAARPLPSMPRIAAPAKTQADSTQGKSNESND